MAEVISGHDDLLSEILVLLPVKSVVRLKCVDKHWYSLISSETFTRFHLRVNRAGHSFILLLGVDRTQFFICHPTIKKLVQFNFPEAFPFANEHVKIVQSCHGLLLLECCYKDKEREKERKRRYYYYVLNPTTKRCRNIGISDAAADAAWLIFDPSKSEYYTVMGIWKVNPPNFFTFSRYMSRTKKWETTHKIPFNHRKITHVLSCSNRAYFIGKNYDAVYYSTADMGVLDPPPPLDCDSRCIVESNGHLHCIYLSLDQNKPCLSIFEMIDNKWSACKMNTDWCQLKRLFGAQFEFLGLMREERMEDSKILVHVAGQIIIFGFGDGACEVLVDYKHECFYQEGRLQFQFKDAHTFLETFASVD